MQQKRKKQLDFFKNEEYNCIMKQKCCNNETKRGVKMREIQKEMLSVEEFSQKANITITYTRQLLRERKIEGIKIGKEWRIYQQEANKYLGIVGDSKSMEMQLYIKELEAKVKNFEMQISTFRNIVGTLENIVGI